MRISCKQYNWVTLLKQNIRDLGYVILEDILSPSVTEIIRSKLYSAQEKFIAEIGVDKLRAANEYGNLRIIMKYEPYFFSLFEHPVVLSILDEILGNTAILHLQNGMILPSLESSLTSRSHIFHRDFQRFLNGYIGAINILFAIDEFTADNGGTLVVPSTHQKLEIPDKEYMAMNAIAVECPQGSALIFDSTLWHAAGKNHSGKDRLSINNYFVQSFFKPQIDYVRALGEETIRRLPERTKHLMGYYSQIPVSLDEYYAFNSDINRSIYNSIV